MPRSSSTMRGGDAVQEGAVVGDGDDAAVEIDQQVFQPVDGVEVQVVGRFVEQQHVGPATSAWASATRFLVPPDSVPTMASGSRCRRCRVSSTRCSQFQPSCASISRLQRVQVACSSAASVLLDQAMPGRARPALRGFEHGSVRIEHWAPAPRRRCAGPAAAAGCRRRAFPGPPGFSAARTCRCRCGRSGRCARRFRARNRRGRAGRRGRKRAGRREGDECHEGGDYPGARFRMRSALRP